MTRRVSVCPGAYVVALCGVLSASLGVAKSTGFDSELDALVPKLLKEQGVPGASLAMVHAGEVIVSKAFGLADTEKKTPVTPETRFNIGSVSKTLTAWSVMTLVEHGLVDLDAPVDRYLKRWHLPTSEFDNDKVTVRRLLSHTSGLSTYPASASINEYLPGETMPTLDESLAQSWATFGKLRVIEEPGRHFSYNNGNYIALQLLIEDVTGERFADYMQRTLFKSLRMSKTGYVWTRELPFATPYKADGKPWPRYQSVGQASGGVYTTASDLAQFIAAAMPDSNGDPVGRGICRPESVRQMLLPAEHTGGAYGLGYKIMRVSAKVQIITHDGANEGWRAMFMMYPPTSDGIVILTNSDRGGKIVAPIVCAWSRRMGIDLSPLCK